MKNKRLCSFLLQLHGKPREIALGFALGLFIGMSPFFGLHTFSAILLSTVLRWNRIASLAGIQDYQHFYNSICLSDHLLLWAASSIPSPHRLPLQPICMKWKYGNWLKTVPDVVATLTIGGFVLGLPMAIGSYFIVLYAFRQVQIKKKAREISSCSRRFQPGTEG